jgi:hypothetical protein
LSDDPRNPGAETDRRASEPDVATKPQVFQRWAPGLLTFGVSVLLTLAVLVSKVGVAVPLVSGYEFLVLLVAQILLILGCTKRGF